MKKANKIIACLMSTIMMLGMPTFNTIAAIQGDTVFNFKSSNVSGAINLNDGSVPIYNQTDGYGFVSQSNAMPARTVDSAIIKHNSGGFKITENGSADYIHNTNANSYNYGGLVFRIDVEDPAAYNVVVKLNGSTSTNTAVAVNGMNPARITSSAYWDSSKNVKVQNHAKWSNSTTWEYDFVTGEKYIEVEIEPSSLPKATAPITVGIESISIKKLGNNIRGSQQKPTVFVLGDSTQKTYSFEEAPMSGYGQIIGQMFDSSKVNVINYAMGGRSMKAMFNENRFNDVLMTANEGDYVLIHSAHNDESTGASEGPEARFGRGSTTATYTRWLNSIYIPAMKARGLNPVLITAVPRTSDGNYVSSFNPDSPSIMKEAAKNSGIECVDLFDKAKTYISTMGPEQTKAIYMSLEAGETPGKTNSGSYANGHPDNKIDGTHYKEAASKVWSKIIAEDIYTQSKDALASSRIKELASYLKAEVKSAVDNNNWSSVFPEWTNDVSLITSGDGSYYRNQIEKLLELGVMSKDNNNNFNPSESITTNDFISGLASVWALDVNDFSSYYSNTTLTREEMAAIVLSAYKIRFGYDDKGDLIKPAYMTNYNGSTVSPEDPNYDPNLTGDEAQYYPLVGWGNLTDKDDISLEYAEDFYTVYNLGLIRSENGIERGKMKNGSLLEPKLEVTRAKAAKELWFLWALGQDQVLTENHISSIYNKNGQVQDITFNPVNYTAMDYEFDNVNINTNGELSLNLKVNTLNTGAKLKAVIYNSNDTLKATKEYDISGSNVTNMDITLTEGEYVIMSVTDGTKNLSSERKVICTKLIVPIRSYIAETVAGIKNGTLTLTNISKDTRAISPFTTSVSEDGTNWWKASEEVSIGDELFDGFISTYDMTYTALKRTINGEDFTGYVTHGTMNGNINGTGSGFEFTPTEDGVATIYVSNLAANKDAVIVEAGKTATQALASSVALGVSGDCAISATLKANTKYYITVLGSKGRFMGMSYIGGAPVVSTFATKGETVEIVATPNDGYKVDSISAVDVNGNTISLTSNSDLSISTFEMPEANVTISAVFVAKDGSSTTTTVSTTETSSETTTVSTTEATTEDSSEETTEFTFVYGDADNNGILETDDCDALLKYVITGVLNTVNGAVTDLSDEDFRKLDVNMDKKVNSKDVAFILQKVLNDSYLLPVEMD